MYGWIWRHLPGPWWARVIIALILIASAVFVLFQWVFPWADATFDLSGNATTAQGVSFINGLRPSLL
ncbi:hypothetical protein [Actinomyces vulturis]|uniref:hypothetical protein n=1 Tax=Actinomyces vulturis TaxID=1857645 RepID=UPI00082B4CC6|nr:hypothetical protein [Actinomyces vulturis]